MEVSFSSLIRQGTRRLLVLGLGVASMGASVLLGGLLLGTLPTGRASMGGVEIAALQPIFGWTLEWTVAAAALLFFGMGCFHLSLARDRAGQPHFMQLSADPKGSEAATTVRVSARSMIHLVAHIAKVQPGVRDARPKVRLAKDGWRVDVDLELWDGHPAAATAYAVRRALLEILPRDTGLPVARLDLLMVRERAVPHRRRVA